MQLVGPWKPGGALWLIWAIDFLRHWHSGNGYAIDHLQLPSIVNPIVQAARRLQFEWFEFARGSGLSFAFIPISAQLHGPFCDHSDRAINGSPLSDS